MKKIIIAMLLATFQLVSAQSNKKITTYKYGHNGMELIVTSKKETIIISTFNSKLELKQDIAEKVYNYYRDNKEDECLTKGDILTITGVDAKVTGKCLVTKKGKLIAVEFYYEKIEWNTGLTELYKNNLG
jgi:hypothetical protein